MGETLDRSRVFTRLRCILQCAKSYEGGNGKLLADSLDSLEGGFTRASGCLAEAARLNPVRLA